MTRIRGGQSVLVSSVGTLALVVAACSSGGSGKAVRGSTSPRAPARTITTIASAGAVAARPSDGCAAARAESAKTGRQRVDLTSGGVDRWYLRDVPRSYAPPKPLPVVIDLHGYMVGATIETAATGLGAYGNGHGYVTITPQGSGDPKLVTWDTALGSSDTRFFGDLLDNVERTLCVDTRRVFVAGYSQGAFMTSTIACTYAARIAAVAAVAGIRDPPGCRPARPVPVVAFHGTADPDIAYAGGLGPAALKLPAPDGSGRTMAEEGLERLPPLNGAAIPTITAAWAARNGCAQKPTTTPIAKDVTRLTWPCAAGHEVELYRVDGGGHTWPGSPFTAAASGLLGATTMSISANAVMWSFFAAHPLRDP